jgi:hypothetical protein
LRRQGEVEGRLGDRGRGDGARWERGRLGDRVGAAGASQHGEGEVRGRLISTAAWWMMVGCFRSTLAHCLSCLAASLQRCVFVGGARGTVGHNGEEASVDLTLSLFPDQPAMVRGVTAMSGEWPEWEGVDRVEKHWESGDGEHDVHADESDIVWMLVDRLHGQVRRKVGDQEG